MACAAAITMDTRTHAHTRITHNNNRGNKKTVTDTFVYVCLFIWFCMFLYIDISINKVKRAYVRVDDV